MIGVELSATDIAVDPGQAAQLEIGITNRQESDDHVAIEIEGIDVETYALPVPSLTIGPGETKHARVLFRVGRSSDISAGTYPFLVRVRGMESGAAAVQQASLTVRPFSALQLEIDPKRATSTLLDRSPIFDLRITNLGNHEETLDLYGSDPEDHWAYEFEKDRVTVKSGATEIVRMAAEPRSRPFVGAARLYQFTVTARSATDAYVSTSVSGQLERKAVLSTVVASLMLVAVLAAAGWWALRPRPVSVRSFTAEPMQVVAGQPVTLAWDIENLGEGTYVAPGNLAIKAPVGSMVVNPEAPTVYVLTARGGGRIVKREVAVVVTPKPPPPRARILEFKADHKKVHQGDVVTLSWRVDGAQELVLNPIGTLNARMDRSRQVLPDVTTTYVLSAQGADGDVVMKSVAVEVVAPAESIADIRAFRAEPAAIAANGKAVLKWSVENATAIELDNGIGGQLQPRGQFEVTPATTTTYTLRAADNKGNVVSKQVTVKVTAPEPEPSDGIMQPPAGVP